MESKSATAIGAGVVSVITPLVFPQIPFEVGMVGYAAAGSLFLYAGRDWLKAQLPARWRRKMLDGDLPIQIVPASPKKSEGAEYTEAWRQYAAEDAGQLPRLPFSEVIKRVAYYSDWANEFEECDSYDYIVRYLNDPWKLLLREVCRPLTLGDIDSWGIKHERNKAADNGPTKIKAAFWTRAEFSPELMLTEPSIGGASSGELGLIYTDIVFDRAGVQRAWPLTQRSGKPSPFEKIYAEWRAKEDEKLQEHQDWINQQHGNSDDEQQSK